MGLPIDSKAASLSGEPRKRQLVHLKTKEECRLGNETIQVWTVELPSKHAEGILKVIKENVENQDIVDLQHLRRFAKPKYLPEHVVGERDFAKEMYAVPRAWETTPPTVMQNGDGSWAWSASLKMRVNNRTPTLWLMVCPSEVISLDDLSALLLEYPPFCSDADSWAFPLEVKEVTVPRLAPTSPEQAAIWSEEYWPTFYRKTNPFGAHPASIEKAENEIQQPIDDNVSIEHAMDLAEQAGAATEKQGLGICTGCVIVERSEDKTEIIAIAGDARLRPLPSEGGGGALIGMNGSMLTNCTDEANDGATDNAKIESKAKRKKLRKKKNKAAAKAEATGCSSGNVMGHAVMRAIGMVGRKRLRCASQPISSAAAKAESNFAAVGLEHDEQARDSFFLDLPLTPLEQEHYQKDNLKPDGYLCLKLEVYLTHEPCMMCSMALVHSRVGRVIFKHRMPKTGGLTAEMVRNDTGPVGLGYGLCWRKELNWQFMCWEYTAITYASKKQKADGGETDNEDDDDEPDPQVLSDEDANLGKLSFTSIHV